MSYTPNLSLRAPRLHEFGQRVAGSYFCHLAGRGVLGFALGIIALRRASPRFAIAAITFAYLAQDYYQSKQKQLKNEWGLTKYLFQHVKGTFPWFSEIVKGQLFLGGLPLKNWGHEEELRKLGVTHVLSIVEKEEFAPKLVSFPVQREPNETWLHIPCADHKAVSKDDLGRSVQWIDEKIKQGNSVLVHCKSGKGRSVMAVIAYLSLHGSMDLPPKLRAGTHPREMNSYIKNQLRHQIDMNNDQMDDLDEFFNQNRQK